MLKEFGRPLSVEVVAEPMAGTGEAVVEVGVAPVQGLTARGDGALALQRHFRNGGSAEQIMVPTENAAPPGEIGEAVEHAAEVGGRFRLTVVRP